MMLNVFVECGRGEGLVIYEVDTCAGLLYHARHPKKDFIPLVTWQDRDYVLSMGDILLKGKDK